MSLCSGIWDAAEIPPTCPRNKPKCTSTSEYARPIKKGSLTVEWRAHFIYDHIFIIVGLQKEVSKYPCITVEPKFKTHRSPKIIHVDLDPQNLRTLSFELRTAIRL